MFGQDPSLDDARRPHRRPGSRKPVLRRGDGARPDRTRGVDRVSRARTCSARPWTTSTCPPTCSRRSVPHRSPACRREESAERRIGHRAAVRCRSAERTRRRCRHRSVGRGRNHRPGERSPIPAEYAFRHPLTRTVAYESQLKSDRAQLHRRLRRAIEARGAADENAALIAQHLEAAGDLHAAFDWHMRAATWSTFRNFAAAQSSWLRARQVADRLPDDDPDGCRCG